MSYELVAEVLDHAPEVTPAEALVLVAIAEKTRRPGRAVDIGTAELLRRARVQTRPGLRKVLARLAARGIEVRVPRGVDSTGQPLYAVPGRAPTYRLPSFPTPPGCDCETCSKGIPGEPLAEKGQVTEGDPQGAPSEGAPTGSPGERTGSPDAPPGAPTRTVPLPLSVAERRIMRATDATITETREIISIIEAENRPRSLPAYVARLAETGDLSALLIRVRSGDRPATSATPGPPRYADLIARQPCPHGMPGGDQPRPGAGTPACPQCRHSTAQVGAPPTRPRGMGDLAEGLAEIAQIKP